MTSVLLLLAISFGLIGICYEVCAPGSIWPGAVGGLLAAVGLFHAAANGVSIRQPLTWAVAIPTGLILVFLISTAIRADRNKTFSGDEAYRDEVGVALTGVHRSGTVRVRREEWKARSEAPVAAGSEIVVRRRAGEVLDVAPR